MIYYIDFSSLLYDIIFISTGLILANYQVIIQFLAALMLSGGAPKELVDNIVGLIVSIVS